MGLFRRKRSEEEAEERCPRCNEPVPEGAEECMMCGVDLRPLGLAHSGGVLESQGTTSPRRIA
jgi:hypothetical protein